MTVESFKTVSDLSSAWLSEPFDGFSMDANAGDSDDEATYFNADESATKANEEPKPSEDVKTSTLSSDISVDVAQTVPPMATGNNYFGNDREAAEILHSLHQEISQHVSKRRNHIQAAENIQALLDQFIDSRTKESGLQGVAELAHKSLDKAPMLLSSRIFFLPFQLIVVPSIAILPCSPFPGSGSHLPKIKRLQRLHKEHIKGAAYHYKRQKDIFYRLHTMRRQFAGKVEHQRHTLLRVLLFILSLPTLITLILVASLGYAKTCNIVFELARLAIGIVFGRANPKRSCEWLSPTTYLECLGVTPIFSLMQPRQIRPLARHTFYSYAQLRMEKYLLSFVYNFLE